MGGVIPEMEPGSHTPSGLPFRRQPSRDLRLSFQPSARRSCDPSSSTETPFVTGTCRRCSST